MTDNFHNFFLLFEDLLISIINPVAFISSSNKVSINHAIYLLQALVILLTNIYEQSKYLNTINYSRVGGN